MPLTSEQIKERFFPDDASDDAESLVDDMAEVWRMGQTNGRAGATFDSPEDFQFAVGMVLDRVAVDTDLDYEVILAFYKEAEKEGAGLRAKELAAHAATSARAALPAKATRAERAAAGDAAAAAALAPPKHVKIKKGKGAKPTSAASKTKGRKAA